MLAGIARASVYYQPAGESAVNLDLMRRIDEQYPLPDNTTFNHYRPARYFGENVSSFEAKLSDETLYCFQQAFDALNPLL